MNKQNVCRRLCEEHLRLVQSLNALLKKLNESKSGENGRERLQRKIESMAIELQEARDQNELLEFRLLELELQTKGCDRCIHLEGELNAIKIENKQITERLVSSEKEKDELIAKSLQLSRECVSLKEQLNNLIFNDDIKHQVSLRVIESLNFNKKSSVLKKSSSLTAISEAEHGNDYSSQLSHLKETLVSNFGKSLFQLKYNEKSDKIEICINGECNSSKSVAVDCADNKSDIEKEAKMLKEENKLLQEQILELEEAENDARVVSQRLQSHIETLLSQIGSLQHSLNEANKTIAEQSNRIRQMEADEHSLMTTSGFYDKQNHNLSHFGSLTSDDSEFCSLFTDHNNQFADVRSNNKSWKGGGLSSENSSFYINNHEPDADDEDLQWFVPKELINGKKRNIGSCFEVNLFKQQTSHKFECETKVPLCESAKPKKILMNCSHQKALYELRNEDNVSNDQRILPQQTSKQNEYSESSKRASEQSKQTSESDSVDLCVLQIGDLERNEKQLCEHLLHLEAVNKQFAEELESREKLLESKEALYKQLSSNETALKNYTFKLFEELNNSAKRMNELESEKMLVHRQVEAQKKLIREVNNNCKSCSCEKLLQCIQRYVSTLEEIQMCDVREENSKSESMCETKHDLFRVKTRELIEFIEAQFKDLNSFWTAKEKEIISQIYSDENRAKRIEEAIDEIKSNQSKLRLQLDSKTYQFLKLREEHEKSIERITEEQLTTARNLQVKMDEMKNQTAITVQQLQTQRSEIYSRVEKFLYEFKRREEQHENRIEELRKYKTQLEEKQQKLAEIEAKNDYLMKKVQQLSNEKNEIEKQLQEMSNKETAYKETLANADAIVADLEKHYKERIKELENSERELKNRNLRLEEDECRLRCSHRPERRLFDSKRSSDLVQELIDAESRECMLREQICKLEETNREWSQKFKELSEDKFQLEKELQEHERCQEDAASMKRELKNALQAQDELQEMLQESEKALAVKENECVNKMKLFESEKRTFEVIIKQLRNKLKQIEMQFEDYSSYPITDSLSLEIENVSATGGQMKEMLDSSGELSIESPVKDSTSDVETKSRHKDGSEQAFSSLESSTSPFSSDNEFDSVNNTLENATKPTAVSNFYVLREVGMNSLLVAWNHKKPRSVSFFKIFVDGTLVVDVRVKNASKALLHNVDLSKSLLLSIVAVSEDGVCSDPVNINYSGYNCSV